MSVTFTKQSGRSGARAIAVWDPLVRIIHWGVVLAILLDGVILEEESIAHQWVGYLAVGLVGVRLIWGLIGSRYARFSMFPPNPFAAFKHVVGLTKGDKSVHLSHNPLGALMAYNIWACILGLGVTGYMMGTVAFFGIDWVKELHEIIFAWLVVSIVLHIAGVLFDGRRTGVPLVRAMIDGKKQIPKDKTII